MKKRMAVRRFTPEIGFPESQGGQQVYSTPWPLGEKYHLCVYEAAASGVPVTADLEDRVTTLVNSDNAPSGRGGGRHGDHN